MIDDLAGAAVDELIHGTAGVSVSIYVKIVFLTAAVTGVLFTLPRAAPDIDLLIWVRVDVMVGMLGRCADWHPVRRNY